jgi:hypothetical protein
MGILSLTHNTTMAYSYKKSFIGIFILMFIIMQLSCTDVKQNPKQIGNKQSENKTKYINQEQYFIDAGDTLRIYYSTNLC